MSQLSLALLGVPEIRHDGQLISFPTRKALALLIYLAVEEGTQPREKITALFWPDSSSAQGRTVLRRTLADLRHALGDDLANGSTQSGWSGEHVWSNRESLRFNLNAEAQLDLHQVRAAAQATRALPLVSSTSAASPLSQVRDFLAQLQAAAALYRGDFLEGFSLSDAPEFDNWMSVQRERWHRHATLIFDWLSQLQFDGGVLAPAIETTARWVAHDPLNEAAHRRLMQLHLAAGNRAAALQAYAMCRALLQRELKAEPAPETQALAKRIRSQTEPARAAQAVVPPALMADAPLIGRASEHLQLVTTFRLSRRGQLHIVSLVGEPGIGKTRLAQEFLAWAAAQGAEVLQGRAVELGGQLPYQPWGEALRARFAQEANPRRWLSDTWLAELSRLLPELSERLPDLPPPLTVSEGEARARLFEAVARFAQALAKSAPLVLFIDDLQWADASALELLHYAARRWADEHLPIMLLVALRTEELATQPRLSEWLASIEHDLAATRLLLGTLTDDDTREWVKAVGASGHFLPANVEAFAQQLFAETRGHPFFIAQTLKELAERATEDFPHVVPRGVSALIRGRLARLSVDARRACAAGAVVGDGFDLERLCAIANLNEGEGLAALEELLARGLLRESGAVYRFEHDKIRQVAYGELSAARRRVLHRRALEALEAVGAPPANLVRHALAVGLHARAGELSTAAGDAAMQLSAPRDAISHYTRARALLAKQADRASTHQPRLFLQLGRAYELISEWALARETYEALVVYARERHEPIDECAALNRLATVMAQGLFDLPAATTYLAQAQQVAERSGDKLGLAETAWNVAHMGLYTWDGASSLAHAERALALARELNQPQLIARGLNAVAWAQQMLGQPKRVEQYAAEAQAMYTQLGDRVMPIECLNLIAIARIYDGRPREAIHPTREAARLNGEIGNEWAQANSAGVLSLALLECGAYAEALAQAQAAVATARKASHALSRVFSFTVLGDIYRALFALDEALAIHLEAWSMAEGLRHPYTSEMVASALCADHVLAENWDEAHGFARAALAVRHYGQLYPGFTRALETEALLRGGDVERAAEDVQRMGEQVAKLADNRRYRLQYLRARATLSRWRGDSEQAIQDLIAAETLAEASGLPGEQWQIAVLLRDAHDARGEHEQARRACARASEIVQSLAAQLSDEQWRSTFQAGITKIGLVR